MLISIIVPCYNEEETISIFYKETQKYIEEMKVKNKELNFEYIFVNDGSKDDSIYEMKKLSKTDSNVKYIDFSRNFGKEAGLYTGLKASRGDYVVVMDVDLQDPPQYLSDMYNFLFNNPDYDCVATRRQTRKGEPPIRTLFARTFYKLINKMTETEIVDGARDYRMMSRKMVDSILLLSEKNRFSKGLFSWVGYKTHWISYDNIERIAGTTKWSFWKLFKYAIEGIISFTTAPLMLPFIFSVLFFINFVILLIIGLIKNSLLLSISSVFSCILAMLLIIFGIQSLYISKMYTEIKNRPICLIKETNIKEE